MKLSSNFSMLLLGILCLVFMCVSQGISSLVDPTEIMVENRRVRQVDDLSTGCSIIDNLFINS